VHLDRKAVDVDGDLARRLIAAGGAQVSYARLAQCVAQRRAVAGGERQGFHQPRLRGLTGQPFGHGPFAGPVPGGHLHGRIVRQPVGIVLSRITHGQGVQALAQQFDQLVADRIRITRIVKPIGQPLGQPQPLVGFAQQKQPAVGRDPLVARLHLDGAIEARFK
jgi:hypothetical protein